MRSVLVGLTLAGAALVGALWRLQARLIYPAPHYEPNELANLPGGVVALRDPALPTSVVGFYRGPSDGSVPQRLWLTFGGNADLSLRWDALVAESTTGKQGFLLIEYPGYGARAGVPTPDSLLTGSEVTVRALALRLGVPASDLYSRASLLGYSLGSAAALRFATHHPVQRLILISPFTSMLDMARRVVGWPLCYLLEHRYDNLSALAELRTARTPHIDILHGAKDSFIPSEMGRAVARAAPGSHFELVPGADHDDVVELATPRLRQLLDDQDARL